MRKFAYYLPQFHEIPENNKWWGKGFTEWVNVKKAMPLFGGHVQPVVPLDKNYYSLDDINTLKWQESLLKKYKMDGLIFYHYYFNGKKLLERPAELLLSNKNIDIHFFFCWANHSWIKTWDGTREVLIEQTYGTSSDWRKHFDYLLSFFKDDRYEKRDNKPVLMVYDPLFVEKNKLFDYFDNRCREEGFDGICIIETCQTLHCRKILSNNKASQYTRLLHLREPSYSLDIFKRRKINFLRRCLDKIKKELQKKGVKIILKYSGDKLYREMYKNYGKDECIHGIFFEWDNTPRHSYRGHIITPVSKDQFLRYCRLIKNDEYVFINAWNEWAEGMMLEPTEHNRYKYLEWIKEI